MDKVLSNSASERSAAAPVTLGGWARSRWFTEGAAHTRSSMSALYGKPASASDAMPTSFLCMAFFYLLGLER
jgi:hypothetical protein